MTVPLVLLLDCVTGSVSSRTLRGFVLLDKVCLFGWILQKDTGPEKQKRFMVNIIHLQKVNALNPLCQVKGHEENCLSHE